MSFDFITDAICLQTGKETREEVITEGVKFIREWAKKCITEVIPAMQAPNQISKFLQDNPEYMQEYIPYKEEGLEDGQEEEDNLPHFYRFTAWLQLVFDKEFDNEEDKISKAFKQQWEEADDERKQKVRNEVMKVIRHRLSDDVYRIYNSVTLDLSKYVSVVHCATELPEEFRWIPRNLLEKSGGWWRHVSKFRVGDWFVWLTGGMSCGDLPNRLMESLERIRHAGLYPTADEPGYITLKVGN